MSSSSRTPLLSLKKGASVGCDEFESCKSSLAGPDENLSRSPRFGIDDEPSKNLIFPRKCLTSSMSLKPSTTYERGIIQSPASARDGDAEADRKSSMNSPILTAGRVSFAPALGRGPQIANDKFRKTGSFNTKRDVEKDYIASIDQMVKDILSVTTSKGFTKNSGRNSVREQQAAGRTSSGRATGESPVIITRTPRDYKRRSLTARAAPPGPKLPDLLKFRQCQGAGAHTARQMMNRSLTAPSSDSGNDNENHGQHNVRLERRLSLSKRADEVMANLRTLAGADSGLATASRASMDPFLLDTSPSPPTTPFKNAARAAAEMTPVSPRALPAGIHELDEELAQISKKVTKKNRDRLASHYYAFYNELIFRGELPKSMPIEWNSRFIRVSGRTTFSRTIAHSDSEAMPVTPRVAVEEDDVPTTKSYFRSDALDLVQPHGAGKHVVTITPICISLSSKLLTTSERLKATLLHEMCHVAQMLFEDSAHEHGAHGKSFLKWLDIARAKAPEVKVQVTHDYSLDAPHYRWNCLTCNQVYQRIQNSINIDEYVCNACQGKLAFLGRYDKTGRPMKAAAAKRPSAYNQFVKDNFHVVYARIPDRKAAMAELSLMWNNFKNTS